MPDPTIKSFRSITEAMAAIKEELAGGKDFSIRIDDQERPVIIAVAINRDRALGSEGLTPEPIVKTAAERLSPGAEEPPSAFEADNELSSVLGPS
jgi:hypothetical protein